MKMKSKQCTRCGLEKPLSEFHRDKRSVDGLRYACKVCLKAYNNSPERKARLREYNNRPEQKEARRKYRSRPEVKAYMKNYRKEHFEKYKESTQRSCQRPEHKANKKEYARRPEQKAHGYAYRARAEVKSRTAEYNASAAAKESRKRSRAKDPRKHKAREKLNKALKRGAVVRPNKCSVCYAVRALEGHHADYDKPLDVVWVCVTCHGEIHTKINVKQEGMKNETPNTV